MGENGIPDEWNEFRSIGPILAGLSLTIIIIILYGLIFLGLSLVIGLFFILVFIFLFFFTLMPYIQFKGGMARPFYLFDVLGHPLQYDRSKFLTQFANKFNLEKSQWLKSLNLTIGTSKQFIGKNDETLRIELDFIFLSPNGYIIISKSAIPLCHSIDEFINSYVDAISKGLYAKSSG